MTRPNRTEILKYLTRRKDKRVRDLLSKMDIAISSLQVATEYLTRHGHPDNSLGVLQYLGAEIDRLCGEINAIDEAIEFVSKGE